MKQKSGSGSDLVDADECSTNEKCNELKCNGQEKQHSKKTKQFFQMYRYVHQADVFMIFFGVIFSILGGTLQALNAVLIIGSFVESSMIFRFNIANSTTPESKEEAAALFTESLRNFVIYNSMVAVSIFVCVSVSTALISNSAITQIYRIRLLYFKSVLNQDISWYDAHSSGAFASHMSEDVNKVREAMGEKLSIFLFAASGLTSSVVMAILTGWKLALVCLVPLVVIGLVIKGVTRLTSKFAKKEIDAYGAAGCIAEEVLSAIRTVVAFGGQQKEAARYSEYLDIARVYSIKTSLLTGVCSIAVWICIYSGYAFGFWRGIRLVIQEYGLPERERVYDTVSIITIFTFVFQASLAFGFTSAFFEVFIAGKAAASRIFALIDSAPVINISKDNGKRMAFVKGMIAFKNVHFSYPSRPDICVLQDLSLVVKPGEKVAFVGASGCGKSTCVQLIQRFYDPSSGQILLDGNNIRELDLTWLRSKIGVVGQEPILFNTTVSQNIKYGNMSATQTDIEKAAKTANAHAFISALSQGYDTVVGERGVKLSGGEKQRIAIARALVRKPSVLLLNEATSALDAKSQAEVQTTLDKVSQSCTTIIVAHRLSTIMGADKIVVISGGIVVEQGTHQALLEKQGFYYNLITAQISETESFETGENDSHTICKYADKKGFIKKDSNDANRILDTKKADFSFWTILKQNGPKWWVVVVACLSLMVMGSNLPIFAIIQGDIIGILASQDHDYMRSQIGRYVTFLVSAGLATGVAAFFQTCTFSITGTRFASRLRRQMFPAMLRQEIGWFDEPKNGVGALCAQLSGEPGRIQMASGQVLEIMVQSVTTLTLAIGLSMFYEWRLTLATLAFSPFIFASFFFQRRILRGLYRNQHASLEDSIRISVEAVGNIRTVASLGCDDVFFHSYKSALSVYKKSDQRSAYVMAIVFGLSRGLMFLASSTSMYYGGTLIRDENLPIEKVFKVVQSITKSTTNLATGLALTSNFHQAVTAANRIYQLITRVPKIVDDPNSGNVKWKTGALEYSQIEFSYPTRPEAQVLKGFDLSALQGRTVALVGPSGSGKSTVLQLLERFYNPTFGQISVDGESISALKLEPFRAALGMVSQEPNLFNKTIADNIAYGDNSRAVSTQEIMEAAKVANIHNFISSLPLGYDTKLGERGAQLSGGQKQRIAIARALIRNPKVLLLDEATSALDSESEKVVQEALNNARKGRTCITIAHRLTTIQDADIICVVSNGSVTEMGTHSQLISQRGLYYKLYNISETCEK